MYSKILLYRLLNLFQIMFNLINTIMIRNKVINAQVKGKMLAIQELSKADYCNDPQTKSKIKAYEKQIQDLTNEKICLKREYKASLKLLRASR